MHYEFKLVKTPPILEDQGRIPDGVDTSVPPMQAAIPDPSGHGIIVVRIALRN